MTEITEKVHIVRSISLDGGKTWLVPEEDGTVVYGTRYISAPSIFVDSNPTYVQKLQAILHTDGTHRIRQWAKGLSWHFNLGGDWGRDAAENLACLNLTYGTTITEEEYENWKPKPDTSGYDAYVAWEKHVLEILEQQIPVGKELRHKAVDETFKGFRGSVGHLEAAARGIGLNLKSEADQPYYRNSSLQP